MEKRLHFTREEKRQIAKQSSCNKCRSKVKPFDIDGYESDLVEELVENNYRLVGLRCITCGSQGLHIG